MTARMSGTLSEEFSKYENMVSKSRAWNERAKKVMPGGISHEVRSWKPFPFVVESTDGPLLVDVDGNSFIDFWMGHYAHIFGHNPPFIVKAIVEQAGRMIMPGSLHRLEIELAEMITTIVPSAEQVRFCTTGTEATMYAVRLARGLTGRPLIAKIEGGWHGPSSELFHAVTREFAREESLGLPTDRGQHVVTLPFNDVERAREILRHPSMEKLAAIIVEPMIGSSWFISARPEYLQLLRDECDRLGAVLIYDEIITGFRIAASCAQGHFGILPDITTLGKALGGGMPIAAVAGRLDIMNRCNADSGLHKWERVRIGGGTYSCHPLSMASSLAFLRRIMADETGIYSHLNAMGERLRERMMSLFQSRGIALAVTGLGSLFTPHFLRDPASPPPINPGQAVDRCFYGFKEKLFKIMLLNRGVYVMHGGGSISMAHDDRHIETFLAACGDIADIVAKDPDLLTFPVD